MKGWMKIIYLHVNKHEAILQVDAINLSGHGHVCPTQNNKFEKSLQYLKKEWRMKLIWLYR